MAPLLRPLALLLVVAITPPPAEAQSPEAPGARSELDQHVLDGWRELAAKRYTAALQRFVQAARLAPGRSDVHLGLGEALFWLGDHTRALAAFERSLQLDPDVAHAHSGMGHAFLNLAAQDVAHPRTARTLLDRADAAFGRALALDPRHEGARQGRRFVEKARTPPGHSLLAVEAPIALLLLALAAIGVLRFREHGLPRVRDYAWPLGLFAGTRALLFVAFALAPTLLPEAPSHPQPVLRDARSVLDAAAGRWDANLYADVAINGYRHAEAPRGNWGTVGQFPLVPVLLRWAGFALDDMLLAALLLPNLALLLACLMLFDLLRAEHGERLATGAVCVMLVHPASLHGSVLYAEAFMLLGLVATVASLKRGALFGAGLWGAFAGLARLNALAIVPWLLLEWWSSRQERSLRSLLARLGPAFGVLLFMLYLQLELDNAFAYFEELRQHRFEGGPALTGWHEAGAALRQLALLSPERVRGGHWQQLSLALLCIPLYVAALVDLLRRRAFGPALFVAAGIVLAAGSNLPSQPRYLWPLFPAAISFARACDRPVLRFALPLCSLAVLLVYGAAFARWYFVP